MKVISISFEPTNGVVLRLKAETEAESALLGAMADCPASAGTVEEGESLGDELDLTCEVSTG